MSEQQNPEISQTEQELLAAIADIIAIPTEGAFNLRADGGAKLRRSTKNIEITSKTDQQGIDIRIKPGTKGETVHIPVVMTKSGLNDLVYNDFYIGAGADVIIVAGCGISNCGNHDSQHDGIHSFHLEPGSRVVYREKHYGAGDGNGQRILNPRTEVYMRENSYMEMEMIQLRGVDSTKRYTLTEIADGAECLIIEKLLTHGQQLAESEMDVLLNGPASKVRVVSRSVAQDESVQIFYPRVTGNTDCFGHVQCDAIIMGQAKVRAIPEITANHIDAQLIHEAAIGRIAGEQILKLMTLGLTKEEAEEKIIGGFLK